jgi:hypothetical protein
MIVDPKDPKRIFTATSRDAEGTTLNIEFNVENNSWEFMGEVGLDEQEAKQQSTYQERILKVLLDNQRSLSGPEIMELMGIGREQRNSVYTVLGRMENKRLINSRPAPGDKRFNLYSLSVPKSDDAIVISLPPPPPLETVSDVDYYSETHAYKGFEDSQHNSQQIVNTKEDCASLKNAESLDSKGINEIVNTTPLSLGGEGVKCVSICNEPQLSEQVSIAPSAPETASTAPTVPPIAPPEPEPDAELVQQIAATLRKAISVQDEVAVKEIVKNIIKRDSTRRLQTAVKDSLTPEENEACRTLLLNRKQSQPQPVEPPAQTTDSITSSEPEAETEPTDPEVVEDVE